VRAGSELDAEVVRRLWRYLVVFEPDTGEYFMMSAFGKEAIPPYSTDQDTVAQVAEFYSGQGWRLRTRKDGKKHLAAFVRNDKATYRFISAETLPEAICRAALAVSDGTNIQSK
jgi:hypothetical protein